MRGQTTRILREPALGEGGAAEEGRSPYHYITNTVESLQDGQRLRLLAAWEPVPLYDLLGNLGFERQSEQRSEDLWVIGFTRTSEGDDCPGSDSPCIL